MPKYSEETLKNQKEAMDEALLKIKKCRKAKFKKLEIGVNGNLNVFPEEIRELTWLTSLSVHCTGIRKIPDWIDELKDIKFLDLSTNRNVKKLPSSISNLKKLIIDNMGLNKLPEFLGNLNSLEFLEICPLEFKEIPQCILDLPKLKRIETRGYDTEHLPSLIAKRLELDRKECLRRIERCKIKKHKKLNLSFLYLVELPEELKALYWLEVLKVAGNDLKKLPEWIGNFTELKELDLDCNELSVLPDSIGKLTKLKSITLDENRLETLPDTFGNLKSLEVFALWERHNNPKLEELYGQASWFTYLPESFGKLSSLKIFSIAETRLTKLPESFGNLKALKHLAIYTSIKPDFNFPKSMINLQNLRGLCLSAFNKVPDFVGELKNLTFLDISHNKFYSLPDFIGNLKKLRVLNLHSTWITKLPEWIENLKNLEDLDISSNDIAIDPEIQKKLPKLKNYYGWYNPYNAKSR